MIEHDALKDAKYEVFFTTRRLMGRRFCADDAAAFQAYRNDPAIARYQSWDGCDEDEARRFVAEQMATPFGEPSAGFQIALALKETNALVGDCYFVRDKAAPDEAEIGFTLAPAHHGMGFATEAVCGLLACVFHRFSLRRVVAVTDCRNAASIGVLERAGLRRAAFLPRNGFYKGEWCDEFRYTLSREDIDA